VLGRDGIAGLVCLGGSLWFLALTRGLPQPALVPIGPGFYPRILLGIMAVARYRLVLVAFAIFAAYVTLMPVLGYRVATFLFVAALQAVLEPPRGARWWRVLAVALITTLVTYYVFERYLSVLLPRGRLTGF